MTTTPTIAIREDVWATLKLKLGLNEFRIRSAKSSSGWNSQNLLAPCSDGQRTAHLVGLAGSYLHMGLDVIKTSNTAYSGTSTTHHRLTLTRSSAPATPSAPATQETTLTGITARLSRPCKRP